MYDNKKHQQTTLSLYYSNLQELKELSPTKVGLGVKADSWGYMAGIFFTKTLA